MILSVAATEHWISSVLVENSPFSIVSKAFEVRPFTTNPFQQKVNWDSFQKGLYRAHSIKKDENPEEIHLSSEYFIDALKKFHIPGLLLDHYRPEALLKELTPNEVNIYENHKSYHLELPETIKIKVDSLTISEQVKSLLDKYIGSQEMVISTYGVDTKDQSKYLRNIIEEFARAVPVAGIWKINFDNEMMVLPVISAADNLEVDLTEYFQSNPLQSDGKVIVAPEVQQVELSRDSGKSEIIDLVSGDINHLDIKSDEKVILKWKSSKSKFEGEIYGSKSGIFIDTNPRVLAKK